MAGTPGMHRYAVRVYYEDTDAGGVVYHANYLRFAERARTEAMRQAGVPHFELARDCGLMFMVRHINLEYIRPARLDDELVVETETLELGAATARLRQSFLAEGQILAVLEVRLACVRIRDGRPARIPGRWRRTLAPGAEEGGAAAPEEEGAG